jgi:hypothetical protein
MKIIPVTTSILSDGSEMLSPSTPLPVIFSAVVCDGINFTVYENQSEVPAGTQGALNE